MEEFIFVQGGNDDDVHVDEELQVGRVTLDSGKSPHRAIWHDGPFEPGLVGRRMLYLPKKIGEVLDGNELVVFGRDVNKLVVQRVEVAGAVFMVMHPPHVSKCSV